MLDYIKRWGVSFCIIGTLAFILIIFLPIETFLSNSSEFQFIFGDFVPRLIMIFLSVTLALSTVSALLPDRIHKIISAIFFCICICAYVQYMFLNKGLDLMGVNPDGYKTDTKNIVINLTIWLVVTAFILIATLCGKRKKLLLFGSFFLFSIQLLALVSILTKADTDCFEYPQTEYHLSGSEQYNVSGKENIIVFILDAFSDKALEDALNVNPDALDDLTDFTFYTNMDSCYCGTYPSMIHMFTNNELDFEASVNKWSYESWNSEKCRYFYDEMHNIGYTCNLYTPDLHVLCGGNEYDELLAGKWDNFTNAALDRETDRSAIQKTMLKMSLYRAMPKLMKNIFYVDMSDYSDVVKVVDNPIMHENYDFFEGLLNKRLSKDGKEKMFIVQHLMGTHLLKNDSYGMYKENAAEEETALGCIYIVNEYISQLKKLGVYDDSTIIITADHGWEYGQQPIFFIKEKGIKQDEITDNNSPVSFHELLPTFAYEAGMDSKPIGETIYSYSPKDLRERTLYVWDYRDEYPGVPYYDGSRMGYANVYVGYTYTGDENDLLDLLFEKPSVIIPMVDSYF